MPADLSELTEAQRRAVTEVGRDVVVSAAAGSGKTRVLSARCVNLVLDAGPPHQCDVDQLLVLTFTRKAAAEMRRRVGRLFADRLDAASDAERPRVKEQRRRLERASIGTIHAFCGDVLRRHFDALGLDPTFEVADPARAKQLKRRAADRLLDRRYGRDDDAFYQLLDRHGDGRHEGVIRAAEELNAFRSSLPDPAAWTARARDQLADPSAAVAAVRQASVDELETAAEGLAYLTADAEALHERAGRHVGDWLGWVEDLAAHARRGNFAAFTAVHKNERPKAFATSGFSEQQKATWKDDLLPRRDALLKPIKELKGTLPALRFSDEDWQNAAEIAQPDGEALLALADDLDAEYARLKRRDRLLDFADLERLTHELLKLPEPLREVTNRVRHVLVDEYQDTNPLQEAILQQLTGGRENLFVVGDVKQSIYRFRLADPSIFQERVRQIEPILLAQNFRSGAAVIDLVNTTFAKLMRHADDIDYGDGHALQLGRADAVDDVPTPLHLLPAEAEDDDEDTAVEREADHVAALIRRDLDAHADRSPGDYAVLLRTMKHVGHSFAAALRRAGVPVNLEAGGALFEAVEVRDTMALLQVLDNPRRDIPLAAFLRSPLAGLADAEDLLARVRAAATGEKPKFHEAVEQFVRRETDEALALRAVLVRVGVWRDAAEARPLAEVLWDVWQETGYLAHTRGRDDGARREANLLTLHELARTHDADRRGAGLAMFVRHLLDLAEDAPAEGAQPAAAQAVRVMTTHSAKGLEFPHVVLPQLGRVFNLKDADGIAPIDREYGLGLQAVDLDRRARWKTAARHVIAARQVRQSKLEELRVLYVAMTRARDSLTLVGTPRWEARADADPLEARCPLDWLRPVAEASPGQFTILEQPGETTERVRDSAANVLKTVAARGSVSAPMTTVAEDSLNRLTFRYPFAEKTRTAAVASVTELARGDAAAQMRLPNVGGGPSSIDVGTATHRLLQALDFANAATPDAVRRQLDALNLDHADAVDVAAVAWLAGSDLGRRVREAGPHAHRELPIEMLLPDDAAEPLDRVLIRGQIDLVLPGEGGWIVVDYKTGRVTEQAGEQLRQYASALELATGKPVAQRHVVDLRGRQLIAV
jgi:ATP-dependent helicase/nuclease subunit A